MADNVKLTKAQAELLEKLAGTRVHASYSSKPARRLVGLGFAEAHASGAVSASWYAITPAGRAYLAEHGNG